MCIVKSRICGASIVRVPIFECVELVKEERSYICDISVWYLQVLTAYHCDSNEPFSRFDRKIRVEHNVFLHVFELVIPRIELHRLINWFTKSHLEFYCSKNSSCDVFVRLILHSKSNRFDFSTRLY